MMQTYPLVYPRIVSTDLDELRLLGAFGECQAIAQLVARKWLVSPVIKRDFPGGYLLLARGHLASATLNHQM